MVVRLSKMDYFYFPRFLQWLQSCQAQESTANHDESNQAEQIIKEWGISNTTLEQVFLILCESVQANYSAGGNDNMTSLRADMICPLCESNPKAAVAFLPHISGKHLMLANSICENCQALSHFLVEEDEYSPLLQVNPEQKRYMVAELFRKAQMKRVAVSNAAASSPVQVEDEFRRAILHAYEESKEESVSVAAPNAQIDVRQYSHQLNVAVDPLNQAQPLHPSSIAPAPTNISLRMGSMQDVIAALAIKNVRLQKYQRYSNCCLGFFVGLIILAIFLIGLIWTIAEICPQGNVVDQFETCDIASQSYFLFHFDSTDGLQYFNALTGNVDVDVRSYLAPRTPDASESTSVAGQGTFYIFQPLTQSSLALPTYLERGPTVWASNIYNISTDDYADSNTPYYPQSSPISPATSWNQQMYNTQKSVYNSIVNNNPKCFYASEVSSYDTMTSDPTVFAEHFADALFECDSCSSDQYGYFKGSLWVADVEQSNWYPYAFVNTPSIFSLGGGTCPEAAAHFYLKTIDNINSRQEMQKASNVVNNTIQSMQFINMLTNSIYDPSGTDVIIQGGVSYYSLVNYNIGSITFLVFLLSMLATLCINAVIPTTIWRLSYEKMANLRMMMNSIGLRDEMYVFGMFIFDFLVMSIIGIIVMVIFVAAKLILFEDVPLGYLILLVLLSAYAMIGFCFVFVRLSPLSSRMTTLLATLLTFGGSICAGIVCVIRYPDANDEEWPNGLSFIPFFAQIRILWVLLNISKINDQAKFAYGMLALFGTICSLLEFTLAKWSFIKFQLHHYSKLYFPSLNSDGNAHKQLVTEDVEDPLQSTSNEDDDVLRERNVIANLSPDVLKSYAILIRNLRREFILEDRKSEAFVAVDDLSLGFRFGEVFGLLGPNGAGKSTTLSIICGILAPTSGDVFIAGMDIDSIAATTFQNLIGICPQSDIFWDNLTVEEHFSFQARLRGVPFNHIRAETQRVAVKVGLDGDAFSCSASTLSGGQRRRLSIGMSIIADPPILFLDEPSAGLDPGTRKSLWQLIASLRDPRRCIILTTHSMEEAETLCSRLGVISEGKLCCLGSGVHLKRKFGTGYTIELSISPNLFDNTVGNSVLSSLLQNNGSTSQPVVNSALDKDAILQQAGQLIDTFMETLVQAQQSEADPSSTAGATLLSAVNLTRKYMISKASHLQIADIFAKMEQHKKELNISQWSISETTLEDIFISLVLRTRSSASK